MPEGMELTGMLAADDFAALLGRARVSLSAARWEDFGQAPLQALDHGAALVSAPAGGPFPALAVARELRHDSWRASAAPARWRRHWSGPWPPTRTS